MRIVTTPAQLQELMTSTTIYAVIVFLLALALAWLVAWLIPWQGGRDRSYLRRRVAFIIIGLVAVLGFWLYNDLVVADTVRNAGLRNMFRARNFLCLLITAGGYTVTGLILMFCFRVSKFGSILGSFKNK